MSDYTHDDLEFDQTNDATDLGGDDGGVDDATGPEDVSLVDVIDVESLLDEDDDFADGATPEDRDPAVGGYSEEGVL